MQKIVFALLSAGAVPTASAAPGAMSPQAAILELESAYSRHDIEAAVLAKDFREEARLMMVRTNPALADDASILTQLAEVLELAFRKQIRTSGFPEFSAVECSLSTPVAITETLAQVSETCRYPDGEVVVENLYATKSADGWRVVVTPAN
jgi:hypothetical protein